MATEGEPSLAEVVAAMAAKAPRTEAEMAARLEQHRPLVERLLAIPAGEEPSDGDLDALLGAMDEIPVALVFRQRQLQEAMSTIGTMVRSFAAVASKLEREGVLPEVAAQIRSLVASVESWVASTRGDG